MMDEVPRVKSKYSVLRITFKTNTHLEIIVKISVFLERIEDEELFTAWPQFT